ncbi:proteasome assembly chaperone 4-like [Physella acuta]|uniref:proteasome assembly chaperone 4-like n=1 Tax=Physella acuta TaxID=109671 RepID=UPI0027DC3828|nr:proteasome assembly chaperone 4-like [Physella acuta]
MSSLSVLDFSDNLLEKTVYFKIIKLEESFFIWVGANPILSNMAVAMPAKYGNIPSGSVLFGGKSEHTSSALAQKLAKKYNSQVFISCSIPFEPTLSLAVERRLVQELNKSIST